MEFIYSILAPLSNLMGLIMNFIYHICSYTGLGNIGICIVVFTFFINLILLPMTVKQQKFARISRIMNPKILEIQEKYKGKQDQNSMVEMQKEMQEMYKHYGINPVSGMGQIFLQMPIFICLYEVISDIPSYVHGITDSAYIFFGLNLMEVPGFHLTIALAVPIMAGTMQWISTKVSMYDTPHSKDDMMNATMRSMNIIMPLVSIFICISLPVYMGIYWIAGSMARTVIQLFIILYMKKYSDEDLINERRKKMQNKAFGLITIPEKRI